MSDALRLTLEKRIALWQRLADRRSEYPDARLEAVRKLIYRRCIDELREDLQGHEPTVH